MKVGEWVAHTAAPAWGVGQVLEIRPDGRLVIRFTVYGTVMLDGAIAARSLVAADAPARHGVAPRGPAAPLPQAVRCEHCGRDLKVSQWSRDKAWKSCPRCSAAHGAAHVYFPFPHDFIPAPADEGAGNDESAQSYCIRCRAGEPAGAGRSCSDVK